MSEARDLLDLTGGHAGAAPPAWLRGRLERSLDKLGASPDQRAAVQAVARRHDRDESEVLLTAGAAEAFVLLARVMQPRHAVAVHPARPAGEQALTAAGHEVQRLILAAPYVVESAQLPDTADLVLIGNPSEVTGVVHERLPELCRPGRVVVVDESLADAVPGEPHSLTGRGDLPGLVVVRSLSRTWSLSGLRVGYLLAQAELVARLRQAQQPWPVSTLGLTALETCLARGPVKMAEREAGTLAAEREQLASALELAGVDVTPSSQAPWLLCRVAGRTDVAEALSDRQILVARGECYPGLTGEHWRVAVRGPEESERLLRTLHEVL